jgi:hypothetical protein
MVVSGILTSEYWAQEYNKFPNQVDSKLGDE